MRIVCLGDVMVDVLARLPGPLAVGSDTPAPVGLLGGGSAANTAAYLQLADTPVALIGAVGSDPLASIATPAGLAGHVVEVPGRPTGTCIVLVGPDGERTMVPDAGANDGLRLEHRHDALFRRGDHLHLSGYTLLNPATRDVGLDALDRARRAGMTVSVDASSAAPLAAVGAGAAAEWFGSDVLVFANHDEATVLTGRADPQAAAADLARRHGRAAVKLGAHGAVWADADGVSAVPTEPVAVVDTTGAGDAFAAGVLAGLARGAASIACVGLGHAFAGWSCRHVGGRPSGRDAVDRRAVTGR